MIRGERAARLVAVLTRERYIETYMERGEEMVRLTDKGRIFLIDLLGLQFEIVTKTSPVDSHGSYTTEYIDFEMSMLNKYGSGFMALMEFESWFKG